MSLLILEGPDGGGKSTLGKQLEANIPRSRYYHSRRPESVYDQADIMNDIRVRYTSADLTILDRAPWISDPIYARVFRRPLLITTEDIIEWNNKPDIDVIWCSPKGLKPSDVSDEYKAHKPPEYLASIRAKHSQIINSYDDFFLGGKKAYKWMKYDYTKSWAFSDALDFANGDI